MEFQPKWGMWVHPDWRWPDKKNRFQCYQECKAHVIMHMQFMKVICCWNSQIACMWNHPRQCSWSSWMDRWSPSIVELLPSEHILKDSNVLKMHPGCIVKEPKNGHRIIGVGCCFIHWERLTIMARVYFQMKGPVYSQTTTIYPAFGWISSALNCSNQISLRVQFPNII